MSDLNPIILEMKGKHDLFGVDAPSIDDVLAQVKSFVNIFKAVDASLSTRGRERFEWLMTATSMSSPLKMELTPHPKEEQHDVHDSESAMELFGVIGTAFRQILGGDATPVTGFPLSAIKEFENLCRQADQGSVHTSTIDLGQYGSGPRQRYTVTSQNCKSLAKTARRQKKALMGPTVPVARGFTELGVIEGEVAGMHSTEKDSFVLHVRNRLDGEVIRCRVGHDFSLGQYDNRTVTVPRRGTHVLVHGKIYYKASGQISSVTAERVELIHSS